MIHSLSSTRRLLEQEQLDAAGRVRALVLQRQHDPVVGLADLEDRGIPQQVDVLAQQDPEGRLIEAPAVVRLQVEILDRQVFAVRDDDLLARQIVFEAELPGPLE